MPLLPKVKHLALPTTALKINQPPCLVIMKLANSKASILPTQTCGLTEPSIQYKRKKAPTHTVTFSSVTLVIEASVAALAEPS